MKLVKSPIIHYITPTTGVFRMSYFDKINRKLEKKDIHFSLSFLSAQSGTATHHVVHYTMTTTPQSHSDTTQDHKKEL